MPLTLSSCGRNIVLSLPSSCHLQLLVGSREQINCIRAPSGLRDLQFLQSDIYMGWDDHHDILVWVGETGEVLYHISSQDFGKPVVVDSIFSF